jgi:carbonic anhydrase
MGASTSSPLSLTSKFKKDETIQTVLKTKTFRFALLIQSIPKEIERIQERWVDFISKSKDSFIYVTTTRHPQTIRVEREGNQNYLTVSTKIEITNTDLQALTKMFDEIEKSIKELNKTDVVGLAVTGSSGSSLNLLVRG